MSFGMSSVVDQGDLQGCITEFSALFTAQHVRSLEIHLWRARPAWS